MLAAHYERLCALDASPAVRVNWAIALGQVCGAELALAQVYALGRYHLFHATRGELLRALGLAKNSAERALLHRRLGIPRTDVEASVGARLREAGYLSPTD
jgi:RNA polymerase sigma-70 factor (ECF subfamily)